MVSKIPLYLQMLINFIILNILRKFNYAKGVALDGGSGDGAAGLIVSVSQDDSFEGLDQVVYKLPAGLPVQQRWAIFTKNVKPFYWLCTIVLTIHVENQSIYAQAEKERKIFV